MIVGLRGTVRRVGLDHTVVGVGGFDLRVAMPLTVVRAMPAQGAEVQLLTFLYIHEDVMALYGFNTEDELFMFEALLTVQGVGPKVALALLSAIPASDLRAKLAGGDENALIRVPGIGKRTAARLVLELKDRMGVPGAGQSAGTAMADELVEALIAWGYRRPDAERVLGLPEIAAVPDPGSRLAAAAARLMKRE
ncbi:MAG TPA: Holliday junction branch migration protein RuvA [Chloroflexota bacterium]